MPSIKIPNEVIDAAINLENEHRQFVEKLKQMKEFDQHLAEHWIIKVGDVGESPTSDHLEALANSVDLVFQIIALQRTPENVDSAAEALKLCGRLHKRQVRLTSEFYVRIKEVVLAVNKDHNLGEIGRTDKILARKKTKQIFSKIEQLLSLKTSVLS
jgi:hypothetical protein